MKKKALALLLSVLCAFGVVSSTGCGAAGIPGGIGGGGSTVDVEIDTDKSQLYVANIRGGIGYAWLKNVISRFEEAYKDEVFEAGKKGVQVIPEYEYAYNGSSLEAVLPTDMYQVYFNEAVTYNTYVTKGLFLDISDVVTASAKTGPETSESKTIESKLATDMKDGLTENNGKYYGLPHYEAYRGVSYDVDLFETKKLFFAANKNNGNQGFIINKTDARSAGPNGVPGDYDDGLPATLEEFVKLCQRMVSRNVIPFVWPGAHVGYTEYIVDAIECSIGGAAEASTYYNYNSNGEQVSVVTGFNSNGTPQVSKQVINNSNGYLTRQLAGRYYGYQMLETIVKNVSTYAHELSDGNSTQSQIAAQEDYICSNLEGNPIGMIIDGNYWWNEAAPAYERSISNYGEGARDRHFAWMPMPTAINDSGKSAGAKEPVLFDTMRSFCFVNSNIKNKPDLVRLAKEFVSFCYSDESLQEFTTTTGVAKGLKYDLTAAQEEGLNYFAKSCWEMRKNATVVSTLPWNKIVIDNERALITYVHKSSFNHQSYNTPYEGFKDNNTAADYFQGQWITQSSWSSNYSKYFEN